MLKDTTLAPNFPLSLLAEKAENLSGSDLKEVCRNAAMMPVREYLKEHAGKDGDLAKAQIEVSVLSPCSRLVLTTMT